MRIAKVALSTRFFILAGLIVTLSLFLASFAQAYTTYNLTFTDSETGEIGTGSFIWDANTETMTDFHWTFAGLSGTIKDSYLAETYESWDPLSRTYGILYYNFLTDPMGYSVAHNGLLSSSLGTFSSDLTGDFDMIALGAENDSPNATYSFLYSNWDVRSDGYVSAATTPEPATMLLLGISMTGLFLGRRVLGKQS